MQCRWTRQQAADFQWLSRNIQEEQKLTTRVIRLSVNGMRREEEAQAESSVDSEACNAHRTSLLTNV